MRRQRKLKPGELAAYFAAMPGQHPDFIAHNELPAGSSDRSFLLSAFRERRYDFTGDLIPSFIDELKARGYDIETIDFRIQKKKT